MTPLTMLGATAILRQGSAYRYWARSSHAPPLMKQLGRMEGNGDVRPPKRKRYSVNTEVEQQPHRIRRGRVEFETETLTREPGPSLLTRFQALSPLSRRHRKPQQSRDERESSRQWAFSPCNSSTSTYKGEISNYQLLCLAAFNCPIWTLMNFFKHRLFS